LIIAWPGKRRRGSRQPDVFIQYRCEQGHYFETLSISNGTSYQEYYLPAGELRRVLRISLN
jgi:hypothetical protein